MTRSRAEISPSFVLLVLLLGCAVVMQALASFSWGHGSFQMTEWLINYAGGFVRRGLPGSVAGVVSEATGIRANVLVIIASFACFLGLGLWLLRKATGTFPAMLILSCVVMGIPAYQDSIVRKDCLGLLLFLGCVKAQESVASPAWRFVVLNLLSIVAILSHETFAFYALPALVICTGDGRLGIADCVRRAVLLLPAAACFLLTVVFHGSPALAEAVNDSWIPLWRSIEPDNPAVTAPAAAIEALGWTSQQGLSLAIYMWTSGPYQPVAWMSVFAMAFFLFLLFAGRGAERTMEIKVRVGAMLATQLVFISPLFILGVDYGRWLFLLLVSVMILAACGRSAPGWVEDRVRGLFGMTGLDRIFVALPAKDWFLLLFGVPVCWNLHNFLTASPLGKHLDLIRSWL